MCVLMVASVYFMGWTYWSASFQNRGIKTKTTLLVFDLLLSAAIIIISTVIGDSSTQAVWAVFGVAGLLRLFYLRDQNAKKERKKDMGRKIPPPPPVPVENKTNVR